MRNPPATIAAALLLALGCATAPPRPPIPLPERAERAWVEALGLE